MLSRGLSISLRCESAVLHTFFYHVYDLQFLQRRIVVMRCIKRGNMQAVVSQLLLSVLVRSAGLTLTHVLFQLSH